MCLCLDKGNAFSDGGATWILESYSDADRSSNKRSSKIDLICGMHYLNTAFVFGSSRSQRTISLSSCESELRSIVSAMCDGIFIVACAQFIFGTTVKTCSPTLTVLQHVRLHHVKVVDA